MRIWINRDRNNTWMVEGGGGRYVFFWIEEGGLSRKTYQPNQVFGPQKQQKLVHSHLYHHLLASTFPFLLVGDWRNLEYPSSLSLLVYHSLHDLSPVKNILTYIYFDWISHKKKKVIHSYGKVKNFLCFSSCVFPISWFSEKWIKKYIT